MKPITTLLAEIPDLAAEVFTTWHAPNPSPKAGVHTRTVPGSKPPLRLDVYDCLRTDEKGDLRLLHGWCITIDDASDGDLAPIPETVPTWVGVTRYLTETLDWWVGQYWAGDLESEVTAVHRRLQQLARTPQPPRYRCDQCGAVAHPQPGGQWMLCEAGHQVEGLGAVRDRIKRSRPLTALEIEEQWGVKASTIRRWKSRGLVVPVGRSGRTDVWSVWDVLTVQHREQIGAVA